MSRGDLTLRYNISMTSYAMCVDRLHSSCHLDAIMTSFKVISQNFWFVSSDKNTKNKSNSMKKFIARENMYAHMSVGNEFDSSCHVVI